jgi:hypothetical protein
MVLIVRRKTKVMQRVLRSNVRFQVISRCKWVSLLKKCVAGPEIGEIINLGTVVDCSSLKKPWCQELNFTFVRVTG